MYAIFLPKTLKVLMKKISFIFASLMLFTALHANPLNQTTNWQWSNNDPNAFQLKETTPCCETTTNFHPYKNNFSQNCIGDFFEDMTFSASFLYLKPNSQDPLTTVQKKIKQEQQEQPILMK
jgi:hypothetical protein